MGTIKHGQFLSVSIIVDMFVMGLVHATVFTWRPEDRPGALLLPLPLHTGPKDGAQVARLAG